MRVLVLAPPRTQIDRITSFTFLDEELRGLADAGIEPFVLTPTAERDESIEGVRMLAIGRESIWRKRIRALNLIRNHSDFLPPNPLRQFGSCIHRARVECAVIDAVRTYDIQILHSHFGPSLGLGGLIARTKMEVPLIATFRGMDLLLDESIGHGLRREAYYSALLPAMIGRADITTYASEFMRQEGLRLGADPSTAITIRKGVDLDHFHGVQDRLKLKRNLGIDGPMILTVAGLIRLKGIDTIIRALGRLRKSHDFTLVVCGRGPQKRDLQRLAHELGIASRVKFEGQIPRETIPRFFAACDIFVLASRLEAAGNVILEAMGAGRPVITTDSGGPSEYVRHERTGFVVPPGDDAALASRLELLLENSELGDQLGLEGRRIASEEHRYETMIQGFIAAFQKAEGLGPARRDSRAVT